MCALPVDTVMWAHHLPVSHDVQVLLKVFKTSIHRATSMAGERSWLPEHRSFLLEPPSSNAIRVIELASSMNLLPLTKAQYQATCISYSAIRALLSVPSFMHILAVLKRLFQNLV
jgi:hypothetical protein